MRVLVPLPVPQLLHELGRGIANMERHGFGGMLRGRCHRLRERRVHAVRLGRGGEIHDGLGERQLALR